MDTDGGRAEAACKVCGDKASGKHYGVPSCDGCRGFFKRSIRRNLDYVCKENNRCIVDVTRRNQCQACRFSKCLRVNMKKDAVQHERAPRTCVLASLGALGGPRRPRPAALLASLAPGLAPGLAPPYAAYAPYPALGRSCARLELYPARPSFPEGLASRDFYLAPLLGHSFRALGGADAEAGLLGHAPYSAAASSYFPSPLPYPAVLGAMAKSTISSAADAQGMPRHISGSERIWKGQETSPAPAKEDEVTSSEETNASPMPYFFGRSTIDDAQGIESTSSSRTSIISAPLAFNHSGEERATGKSDASMMSGGSKKFCESRGMFPIFEKFGGHTLADMTKMMESFGLVTPGAAATGGCDSIYEAAAQVLFLSVQWVKGLPSFLYLADADQELLHGAAWRELFILTAAQWGLPVEEGLNSAHGLQEAGLREHARRLGELLRRFSHLAVDPTEYACLKATVLFRPDISCLQSGRRVEILQEHALEMLHNYCTTHHCPARYGRLLLLLPPVACLSNSRQLEDLLFRRIVGDVSIEKLLRNIDPAKK